MSKSASTLMHMLQEQYAHVRYGVKMARKGGVQKSEVLNTMTKEQILDFWK